MGPLLPDNPDYPPQIARLYIVDGATQQLYAHQALFPNSSPLILDVLQPLQEMLHACNHFVQKFRIAAAYNDPSILNLQWRITNGATAGTVNPRLYNVPQTSELAAFIQDAQQPCSYCGDIVVHRHGGGVKRMTELNHAYDPLHFVLLFPCGEADWHDGLHQVSDNIEATPEKPILWQFRAYQLQVSAGANCVLYQACKIAEEYFVDMFAKIEQSHLA